MRVRAWEHRTLLCLEDFLPSLWPVVFEIVKAHLSSLICSGQISREEALEELKIKCWETKETLEDKNYVLKKLGVSEDIFDNWMQENPVSHLDFPSYLTRHNEIILSVKKYLGKK